MSGDPFAAQLLARPEITQWVSVQSLMSSSFIDLNSRLEELNCRHRNGICTLSNFYNGTHLVTRPICSSTVPTNLAIFSPFCRRVYHQLRYLDRKIARLSEKHHDRMSKVFDSIIEFLMLCPPTSSAMYVSVEDEKLIKFAQNHPKCVVLRAYAEFRAGLITNVRALSPTEDEVMHELVQIIETVASFVDPKTSFFPMNRLQPHFERVFMCEKSPFREECELLIKSFPPEDSLLFLDQLFALVVHCLQRLGINKKPNDAALVLLIIRFVFDRVYDLNTYFADDGEDILAELRDLTLGYLSPPADFMPPFDRDGKVVDFFRNDPGFLKAINELYAVTFQTNPFDILACVEKSLTYIERAAFNYNKGQTLIFPFEVTFGLFLGVALGSQIRNWANIANFVEAFTPMSGLCPAFEFSRAKIVASLMQFQQIIADLHPPPDEMPVAAGPPIGVPEPEGDPGVAAHVEPPLIPGQY
jgi:hypothetical protein